jgi:hypothetical protein
LKIKARFFENAGFVTMLSRADIAAVIFALEIAALVG